MIKRNWRKNGLRALFLAGLVAHVHASAASPSASGPAETVTVLFNAKVFTGEPAAPYAEAVAIANGQIVAVGERQAVMSSAGARARLVDLHGHFLMPGMIDAHAHPIGHKLLVGGGGMGLVLANYAVETFSADKLEAFVADTIARNTSHFGDVVLITGIDIGYWAHTKELDALLSGDRFAGIPIVLVGSDGHTAWANATARMRAGLSASMVRALPAGEQRYFGFNAGFEPNGFVVDHGLTRLLRSLPDPAPALLLAAGRAGVQYMNAQGITAWLDAAVAGVVGGDLPLSTDDPGALPTYRALSSRGELTAHVAAYPVIDPAGGLQQLDMAEALRAQFRDVANLTMPGIKVFADGVVEYPSQTAALTQPYRNSGRMAPLLFDPAAFNALVAEADRRGLTVHIHAIGNLAVKASLDAIGTARKANPGGQLPHTITHAQFVDNEDVGRFAQLRTIAALQLLWATADPSTNEEVAPYIAPAILHTMYPARALLQSGALIAGASDWSVTDANPFLAIAQAETRSGPQGILGADQRMPREAMLYAYTKNAARALGQESRIGTLAPGKSADLVLVDVDVLTVSPDELRKAKVMWTMFEGKIVYGTGP